MHFSNELSFSLGVMDPSVGTFFLFGELDQPGLKSDLLVSLHLKVVFSNHHMGLRTLDAQRAHPCHKHFSI
jgi:hypothetical protein